MSVHSFRGCSSLSTKPANFARIPRLAGYATGFGVLLFHVAGDIVIPIDGGTVPVHATLNTGGGPTTVDATVTATVTQQ